MTELEIEMNNSIFKTSNIIRKTAHNLSCFWIS